MDIENGKDPDTLSIIQNGSNGKIKKSLSNNEALLIAERFINITDLELSVQKGYGSGIDARMIGEWLPIPQTTISTITDFITTSIAAHPTMFNISEPSSSASFQIGGDDDEDEFEVLEGPSEDENESGSGHNPNLRDPVKHACKVCANPISYATNRKNHVIAHLGLKPWKCPICFKHYTRPHSTALHIAKFHPEQHLTAAPVYDLSEQDAQEVDQKIIEYFPSIKRQPVHSHPGCTKTHREPRRRCRQFEQIPISCQVCHKEIRNTATGKSRHVLTHVHVKPWKCALCNSYYTRPNLVTPHFAKMHPGRTMEQPAVYQLSETDELQICEKTNECFPITWKRKIRIPVEPEESDSEEPEDKRREWMRVVERISPIREEAPNVSSDSSPTSSFSSEDVTESSEPSSTSAGTPKLPSALAACKICGKQFGYTSNKKRHVMFHMKLTPFKCPLCDSKFAHITTASKHFNQKHTEQEFKPAIYTLTKEDEDLIEESIQKLFPLASTPKVFSGKRKARETCQICMKSVIGSATDRKRHVIIHMGIKPWKCSICDEAFTRQNVVMDHIKKKHPGVQVTTAIRKLTDAEEQLFQEQLKICFPDVWARKNNRIVHTPVHRFL